MEHDNGIVDLRVEPLVRRHYQNLAVKFVFCKTKTFVGRLGSASRSLGGELRLVNLRLPILLGKLE